VVRVKIHIVIRRIGSRLLRLLALLAVLGVAAARVSGAAVTALAVWQDNITNTTASGGRLPAWTLSAMASDELRRVLPNNNAFFIGGNFDSEACMDYHGLNFASAGPAVGFQHKFGLGAYVPTLRFDLAVNGIAATESARAGWSDEATFGLVSASPRPCGSTSPANGAAPTPATKPSPTPPRLCAPRWLTISTTVGG